MKIEQLLSEYLKKMNVYLWGTGKCAEKVVNIVQSLGIDNYYFIDMDELKQSSLFKGRYVYGPKQIEVYDENNYIIVACNYYEEIEQKLILYGYKKYKNYIDGLNFDNSILEMKYKTDRNVKFVTRLTFDELLSIEKEMENEGINLEQITIHNKEGLADFEEDFNFKSVYKKTINIAYERKLLEYWMAYQLLNLEQYVPNDIYLDVGSSSTPWVMYLREIKNMKAYGIDLIENPLHKDYYLVGDATCTPFANESVRGISLQSSYCLFMDNGDIKLLRECSRILKCGGKLVISPLYMYPQYISAVSARYYGKGYNDEGQMEVIRDDCPYIQMSRYYDVRTLADRILSLCDSLHMNYKIYVLPNEQIPQYDFAYLKFVLEFEKY